MAEETDFDDVPPLEDMSELLHQVEAIQEKKPQSVVKTTEPQPPISSQTDRSTVTKTEPNPVKPAAKKDSSGFGGFKKGFMFGGNTKPSQNTTQKRKAEVVTTSNTADIPLVKPVTTKAKEDPLRLSEVQNAMDASQAMLQNKDNWLTEDLLEKVSKSPSLMQRLTDRKFVEAFSEFQSNPSAAQIKYQNNPEMQGFLQEFCGMMGNHFNLLGDEQPADTSIKTAEKPDISVHSSTNPHQATSEDERKMNLILADPEIREILQDPRIQKMFEVLRTDPDKAQRVLQSGDADVRRMVRKLCDAGLLQLQTS